MIKNNKLLLLFISTFGSASHVYAWQCGQSCPSSYLSGRAECLAYNETCKVKAPSAKDLWGRAGKVAMPAAEQIMKARNQRKEPLSAREKYALRPIFGNLVDRINVRYNSRMLDKWSAGGYEINLSGVDTIGQAYGYDVFVAYPKSRFNSEPADMLHLLIHEITHVEQMKNIKNTVSDFGYRYFWEFKVANLSYENNKLEREAEARANNNWRDAYNRYRTFTQQKPRIPVGNFKFDGRAPIYFSNGSHYCWFNSWEKFLKLTDGKWRVQPGRLSDYNMVYDGVCTAGASQPAHHPDPNF